MFIYDSVQLDLNTNKNHLLTNFQHVEALTMSYELEMYGEKPSERSRWSPLTRMLLSGEMTQEKQQELSSREKFDRWMINEGYRRV